MNYKLQKLYAKKDILESKMSFLIYNREESDYESDYESEEFIKLSEELDIIHDLIESENEEDDLYRVKNVSDRKGKIQKKFKKHEEKFGK